MDSIGHNIPSVHGLLPAEISRRILSLAAVAVFPAALTAVLALAAPAQASPAHPAQQGQAAHAGQAAPTGQAARAGRVSIVIDSMTPQTARPGSTVTVAGTVTNGTSQTKAGLDVQLWTSPARFQTRDEMDGYVSQGSDASLQEAGNPFSLTARLTPGATVNWHASFQVNTVGMTQFGVYPVSAQLDDSAGRRLGPTVGGERALAVPVSPEPVPGPHRNFLTRRPAVVNIQPRG